MDLKSIGLGLQTWDFNRFFAKRPENYLSQLVEQIFDALESEQVQALAHSGLSIT